jgi:signal transduction histidine kinase
VAAETVDRASPGEASFQLLAEHLPDLAARFVHPADFNRVAAYMERLPTDPTPFAFQHRIVRGDGTVRSVLVRGEGEVDELLWQVTKDLSSEVTSLRRTIGRLRPLVLVEDDLRVAQQALANAVDHAKATHALVAIECSDRDVVLRVSDDGCGFDPDHVQVIADIAHFGLIAMRERVEALGGRFRVTTAPGRGTVIEARLPLTDPTERWGA